MIPYSNLIAFYVFFKLIKIISTHFLKIIIYFTLFLKTINKEQPSITFIFAHNR